MPGSRDSTSFKVTGWGWVWAAVATVLVAVPIVLALGVPATPLRAPRSASTPSPGALAPRTASPHAGVVRAESGDPDLGVAPHRTPYDVEYDALEAEMAILRGEKSAIEAEEARLRGARDELEAFDRDHPDGVPPELFAHYEDARAKYNSDVQAYKSRAAGYQMRLAELERRVEALRDAAPGDSGAPATP